MRLESLIQSLPDPQILLTPMRRREVAYSSKIENTIAAVQEVALAEINTADQRAEVLEVRNNLKALDLGAQSPLPMCLRLIREMHKELMTGVRGGEKTPGEFRTGQVFIGKDGPDAFRHARFVPPPPGQILHDCLSEYEKFLNPGPGRERPKKVLLLELAMSHYQFESIHPFSDGNGRLGRLIITLTGFKTGELAFPLPYISRYLEANRQEYYDRMLAVSQQGNWEGWFRFFCRAVLADCVDGADRARRLLKLRETYREKLQTARNSSLLLKLVDLLFKNTAVTVVTVRVALSITAPPAQKHIQTLVDLGVLREITGGNYARVWVADAILNVIET